MSRGGAKVRRARAARERRLKVEAEQVKRLPFLDDPERGRQHAAARRAQQGAIVLSDFQGYYVHHLGLRDPGEGCRTWGQG